MHPEELLLRRLQAQHLIAPTDAPAAARDLCGFQAQFLRNATHALRLRTGSCDVRGLIKTWTLRGTVHLIPESDLPLYLRRCGTAGEVCDSGWYRWRAAQGNAPDPAREQHFARLAVEAIVSCIDTREALRAHFAASGMTAAEEAHLFDPWGGLIRELADLGILCFRVDMADDIRPIETKRYRLLPPFTPRPEQEARQALLHRYIAHYGPVTLRDAAYFFRWTQAEVKALLPLLPVEPVTCNGATCYHIPVAAPTADIPPVILLAGFDPLMLGYRKEDNPFLPAENLRGIFNLAGIVNPAILLHGRVAGKWKEKDGKVELTAFEPLAPENKRLIEQEAARLFTIKKLKWT